MSHEQSRALATTMYVAAQHRQRSKLTHIQYNNCELNIAYDNYVHAMFNGKGIADLISARIADSSILRGRARRF